MHLSHQAKFSLSIKKLADHVFIIQVGVNVF